MDHRCRLVLGSLGDTHGNDACIFGNVLDMVALEQWDESWPYLTKAMALYSAPMRYHSWCFRHHWYCPVRPGSFDISGTPCQDFSPSGGQAGIHGRTKTAHLTWGKLQRDR